MRRLPPSTRPTDISSSDGSILAEICERLRPRLIAFVRQRGIGDAAEDVVQEALLAAFTRIQTEGADGIESVESWLYGILKHKLADHRRRASREGGRFVPIDEPSDQSPIGRAEPRELGQSPATETEVLVNELLDQLPPRQWLVLMLNQRLGLPTREIAPRVRLSVGRTGAILADAKARLRRGLTGEESRRRQRLKE